MENKKRRLFVYLLFTASFLMLVVPTIPHHHHKDDPQTICMKNDIEKDHNNSSEEESHSATANNHSFEFCLCTQTDQPTSPSFQSEITPDSPIVAVFLSNPLLRTFFAKQKEKTLVPHHYKDKIASLYIPATRGLRAPPSFL